ncbi:MAG: response regulator [Actinomycetota bacterium]
MLVDDHQVVRSGLKMLIEAEPDIEVVGEADTASGGVQVTEELTPDLVVMDLRLPDMSGIAACKQIVEAIPDVQVLILTSYADRGAVRAASAAGASGYVLKRAKAFELVSILRRVARDEEGFVVDPEGSEAAVEEEDHLLATLSPQEKAVARYIARGLSNREIAAEMSLAEKTVKNYVSHVLTKMSFQRRSEAAAYIARIEAEADRWTPSPV